MEQIEFLYFPDCPNWKVAWRNLRDALTLLDWQIQPQRIIIEDDLQAEYYSFQGSPSIKYNGIDLWKETRGEYHMGCRVYRTPNGLKGAPSVEMLVERLRELQ